MNKNTEITQLAEKILLDITDNRIPLHSILLKAARLSLLLDIPQNVKVFKEWAVYAEKNQFVIENFRINIEAAKDPNISVSSSNEYEHVTSGIRSNYLERVNLRNQAQRVIDTLARYRAETYSFVLGVYTKWKFGNVAESIFEKKRKRTDPILREIFPDVNQRLNSIESNILSNNREDWKNAVFSCRTLLMDLADVLNSPKSKEEKQKYINRLKDFVSPQKMSKTKKKLLKTYLEELKKRIEHTIDMTQGGAHKDRPSQTEAENIVLYTYLVISDLVEIYSQREKAKKVKGLKE